MKIQVHKGCGCSTCRQGLRRKGGHFIQKQTQKKLRRKLKLEIFKYITLDIEPTIPLISTPYTD